MTQIRISQGSPVNWPPTWRTAPLWSIFERVKDVGHPEEELLSVYREHGVVKREQRDDNFNKAALDRNIYQLVHPGWLVVNRMKAWQGSVGVSPYRGIVSGHYICFRPTHGEDHRFLNWLFRSAVYTAEYASLSRGVRPNQVEIDNDWLRSLRVFLPPTDEQRRIADFLDAETARIDALSRTQKRLLSVLAERRTAGVAETVSGGGLHKRRKSTLAWLESIPASWQEVRVGLLAQMGSGHTPSRSRPDWWTDCLIPWITTGEVKQVRDDRIEDLYETREKISELGMENSSAELHPKGTVFLCRTASAGYSGVMGRDMATSQDFVTWTCGPRLNPYYLLWCLRAMRPDLLGRLAMGSTHKTIYVPDLQMLRIPLPPLKEQENIVAKIRKDNAEIDVLVDKARRQGELLQERRQALITAAVTGQFDVSTASGRGVDVS
ncbi:restriction endonuclease subunit S [Streptomyces sp. NPDC127172]|uniref:restriction endonuclease subunit S n=1 Tax=Streptomyces sp. NPDC127172 TaxID=3345382 RepID=UPI003639C1C3